jgi:MarR family transcriptional regulator, 2-MHQ and catechol-resistance regulon repressor
MPTHHQGPPDEVRALDAYVKLVRAADSVERVLAQHIDSLGLSWSQFGVLEALLHLGPQCHKDLATRLLRSRGNLTLVIQNLESRALVQRERDAADRRQVNVSLTEQGHALIAGAFPAHAARVAAVMAALDPDEQEALGALCRTLGWAAAAT